MSPPDVDAVGYGLEVAPGRERRSIARRIRLKARLLELPGLSEASGDSLAPEIRFLQLEPGETDARRLIERATECVERSRYPLAVSLIRRVVREFPNDANAWHLLGFALGEIGRRSESIECFDRVIGLKPNLPEAYANRGWQRFRSKDLIGAVSDLKQATDLDPKASMAWSHLGLALSKAKKIEEAAEAYRNSVFTDEQNGKACLALASCLRRLGRKEEVSTWRKKAFGLMTKRREPKPSMPTTSEYRRHATGRVLKRESLVVDIKAQRRQKQLQRALAIAQNPVAWMMFLILFLLLYVLLGN